VRGSGGDRVSLPGHLPGDELEEHRAERVEIRACVEIGGAFDLLRGHVGRRADDAADGPRQLLPGRGARDPEVGDDRASVLRDDHVLGLEVTVKHVRGVCCREPGADVEAVSDHVLEREPALAREQRSEHLALDELHRQEAIAAVFADVVGARDVLVRHASRELHLAPEALDHVGGGELFLQHLERDDLVELAVSRAVDGAHRACAEHPEELVAPAEELRRLLR